MGIYDSTIERLSDDKLCEKVSAPRVPDHPAIVFTPHVHEVARTVTEFLPEIRMVKKVPNPIDKHVGSRVRMRRMMLGMSQEKLGDSLGLTFQQVQKYEKGSNRIGASRLQQISHILQVPVSFFFEGAPSPDGSPSGFDEAASPAYVTDFLATPDGLALVKAFIRIPNAKLRRRLVELVEEMAGEETPN